MIDSNSQKQPKANIVVAPKSSPAKAMMLNTVPSQDRIRERAYELYESRGRESGHDERDWLCAEQEILKRQR
ncbi:MAG: DUF2934 domain-containing protein [Candidatus Sulfotelmatobacter sp.]|jgi:ABC-type tungstate transport system permease subunit